MSKFTKILFWLATGIGLVSLVVLIVLQVREPLEASSSTSQAQVSTSSPPVSDCVKAYKEPPEKFKVFIEENIGERNLFNMNALSSLGMISHNCPHTSIAVCKPNSWGNYDNNSYHYPKINGLYAVDPSEYGARMFVGRVLDDRYFVRDVKKAISQQIGLEADKDAALGSNLYYYIGNGESKKFKLFGKYLSLVVYIYSPRDVSNDARVTSIDYHIEDDSRYVNRCIEKEQSDQQAREKGKQLRL